MQIKKKTDKLGYSIFNLQYRLKINIHNNKKTKNKKAYQQFKFFQWEKNRPQTDQRKLNENCPYIYKI